MTNHPSPLQRAKRKASMTTTPHEKAKPAMTVVASASSLITRQPAHAHAGALSRRVVRKAIRSFTI
jgi:hypothetical protein